MGRLGYCEVGPWAVSTKGTKKLRSERRQRVSGEINDMYQCEYSRLCLMPWLWTYKISANVIVDLPHLYTAQGAARRCMDTVAMLL